MLALSLVAIGTILIRKSLRQLGADKKFKNKLYHLISVVLLMQFIPNSVLFKYFNYPHILWGKKIAWKDFQAPPDTTSIYSAGISTTFFYKVNKVYDYPQAMVITKMKPEESWCKPIDTTGIYGRFLLDHEQVHFDITEVWKRKTTDNLWSVWGRNHQQIDSTINYYYKQERKMQIQYDSLTQHGADSLTQVKWRSLITNQLNK